MSAPAIPWVATLEALGALVRDAAHPQIGVCIDTAHLWGSGYDLTTAMAWARAIDENRPCHWPAARPGAAHQRLARPAWQSPRPAYPSRTGSDWLPGLRRPAHPSRAARRARHPGTPERWRGGGDHPPAYRCPALCRRCRRCPRAARGGALPVTKIRPATDAGGADEPEDATTVSPEPAPVPAVTPVAGEADTDEPAAVTATKSNRARGAAQQLIAIPQGRIAGRDKHQQMLTRRHAHRTQKNSRPD